MDAGQTITGQITARPNGSTLDSLLILFDSFGNQVAFNDDFNGLDSKFTYLAPSSGSYYIAVSGYYNIPLSPFDSASGSGARSRGSYRLDVTLSGEESHSPGISGNGQTVAFTTNSRLFVYDVAGEMLRAVSDDFIAFEKPARPAIDFTGENIVFAAQTGNDTTILRYSSSLDQVLVLSPPLIESQPELTEPDIDSSGRQFLFQSRTSLNVADLPGLLKLYLGEIQNPGD